MQDVSVISVSEAHPAVPTLQSNSQLPLLSYSWKSIVRPSEVARRTMHVSVRKCWLIHAATALAGLVLVPSIIDSPVAVVRGVEDVWLELSRSPVTTFFLLLGIALAVEAGHLGAALVVSSWGAHRDERIRHSLGHALRQVFLRTPHALLVIALIAVVARTLELAESRWRAVHGDGPYVQLAWPNPPTIPPTDPTYRAALRNYLREMQEYQLKSAQANQAWTQWQQTQPWYMRYDEPLTISVGTLSAAWWLAALLVAVGIKRAMPKIEQPPRCLVCGYDLTTIPMDSRCPECGEQVASSLGPQAQSGPHWERRGSEGIFHSWWRTWRRLMSDRAFGRTLRLDAEPRDARLFLALHLPVIFALGAVGIIVAIVLSDGTGEIMDHLPLAALICVEVGAMCVLGTVLVACGSASLIGWYVSLTSGRNLLPAAIQAACYGGTFLMVWAFFGAVLINSNMHLYHSGWFQTAENWTGIPRDTAMSFSILLPNGACGIAYLILVGRVTAAARYANK